MGIKITGFDALEKRLKQMKQAAEELDGTHQIPISELFTSAFMAKYTNFNSFDELLAAGDFVVNNSEDFKAIPDDAFDLHISKNTQFNTWQDMMQKAGVEYAKKKMGL